MFFSVKFKKILCKIAKFILVKFLYKFDTNSNMFEKRGQGQSWSLDIILAFVVFVLVIGIVYSLIGTSKDKTQDLTLESNTVVNNLDSANSQKSNLTIITRGNIEQTKLEQLYTSDYNDIKRQLGIKGEFCIYIVDQNNNLVTVNTTSGEVGSFGNGNLTVNNKACGSALP